MSGLPSSYLFPPAGETSRAVALTPFASGVLVPEWDQPNIWIWNGSQYQVTNIPYVSGSGGFSAVTTDSSGVAWIPQYYGSVVSFAPGNVYGIWPSLNDIILGAEYVPAYNNVYYLGAGGSLYSYIIASSPLLSQTGGILLSQSGTPLLAQGLSSNSFASFNNPSWFLETSGTTLFTLLPSVSAVGTFSLTSISTGSSGFIQWPFPSAFCLAASTGSIAVGGMTYAALPKNYQSIAGSPISPTLVAVVSSSIDLYTATTWPIWTYTQSVTAAANPSYVAWGIDGLHFAVSDPISGIVSIFNYVFSTPSPTQTLGVSGASNLCFVSPNNLVVLQSNQVTSIYGGFTGWSLGNQLALSGITSLAPGIPYQALAGIPSGVAFLGISSVTNNVSLLSTIPLTFTPQAVASDLNGLNGAVGSIGSSGYLAILNGQSLSATLTWIGSGTGIQIYRDQILVADSSVPSIRTFGLVSGQYQQIASITTVPSGLNGLVITPVSKYYLGSTIFALGSGNPFEFQLVSPWGISNIPNGVVGIYTSGWTQTQLGVWEQPTALNYDQSGNLRVATLQNSLYTIDPSGNLISAQTIQTYTGQLSGVPLGISDIIVSGNNLFGASSLNGALVCLTANLGSPWIS